MPFYDHFYLKNKEITNIGRWILKTQDTFLMRLLLSFSKKDNINILEIGPGMGHFAEVCSRYKNIHYQAIEANEKLASLLKEKGFNVDQCLIPPINKDSDSFDIILLSHVLEHMNDCKTAVALIKECSRILKKDGIIIIVSPDYLSCRFDFFEVDYTHNYVTTLRRIKQLIEDENFATLCTDYISGPFRGRKLTFLVNQLIRFLYFTRFPYIFSLCLKTDILKEKIYYVKTSFLRNFVIIARKASD